jgi:hypothetical protein
VAADLGPELERLPGVLAATIFTDAAHGPMVYLATRPGVDRTTLRTVVRARLADAGMAADPDRIHIGIVPPPPPMASPLPDLSLDALEVRRADAWVECAVRLRADTGSPEGRAREPDTPTGRSRAGARAALTAAEALDPDLRLGLHGCRRLELAGWDTLIVLVEALSGRASARLPGIELVERSIEESAALAALGALRSWRA